MHAEWLLLCYTSEIAEIHSPGLAGNPSYRVLEIVSPEPFCSEYLRGLVSVCCRSWILGKLLPLQKPGVEAIVYPKAAAQGEAVCATELGNAQAAHITGTWPWVPVYRSQRGIPPACLSSASYSLKLNIMLTDKGTIFKGHTSIFTKQAMKSDFRFEMQ